MPEDSPKKPQTIATEAVVAALKPSYHELKAGQTYLWCSCGLSKKQPFCDFSHRKASKLTPVRYQCEENQEVLFCECKQTKTPPFCDGTHNNLPGGYALEDPNSKSNQAVEISLKNSQGRAALNGQCYIASINQAQLQKQKNIAWCELISKESGAIYQSLFYFQTQSQQSGLATINFANSESILLITAGTGKITIAGKTFPIEPHMGVYVCANETFSLQANDEPLQVYACACPQQDAPDFLTPMRENFNSNHPERVIKVNEDERNTMGTRFFQILVDKQIGSSMTTQFIGEIPQSMAAYHRHLYEEVLVILSGEGYMWTENLKAKVGPGDIIFLPRKQVHSLQCTNPEGMLLAGVIYPGDNPSINY